MGYIKIGIITFCFMALNQISFSQTILVKGIVLDESTGLPVEHASVYLIGTTQGAFSKLDGTFNITTDKKADSISVSYIGYTKLVVGISTHDSMTRKAVMLWMSLSFHCRSMSTCACKGSVRVTVGTPSVRSQVLCCWVAGS